MKAFFILSTFTGASAFAAHAPIPLEQLTNGDELIEKTRMKADACVSNKLECEALREEKGASSYVTIKDAEECLATNEQDTETVACYLKD